MTQAQLLPDLFKTEYRKIISVLCSYFGLSHIEIAEDIASDTFLQASESWLQNGIPDNPPAWLYVVAKNKAKDYLKRKNLFEGSIQQQIITESETVTYPELEFSESLFQDSQLKMLFAICHPAIPPSAQIGLALRILCGFGIDEIANAFLTNKENINKRLLRAKDNLRELNIPIQMPPLREISQRLNVVLRTLYLLFNEGYSSSHTHQPIRKELCLEALRLAKLLTEFTMTNQPEVNALLALMCFNASRFDARLTPAGNLIPYHKQDVNLWDKALIDKGNYYLVNSSQGAVLSKYHIEAGIAFWHTQQTNSLTKWQNVFDLYSQLLTIEYSAPIVLNQIYALSKLKGNQVAILEAEKLNLSNNLFYHTLLGELYSMLNKNKAIENYTIALKLTNQEYLKCFIGNKIRNLNNL